MLLQVPEEDDEKDGESVSGISPFMLDTDLLLPLDGDDLAVDGDSPPLVADVGCDSLAIGIIFKPRGMGMDTDSLPDNCIEKGKAWRVDQATESGEGLYCYINSCVVPTNETNNHSTGQ